MKDKEIFPEDWNITLQNIEGELLPEIGYYIRKDHTRMDCGTGVAKICIDYAFVVFHCNGT